jgi:serine protease inhibitor
MRTASVDGIRFLSLGAAGLIWLLACSPVAAGCGGAPSAYPVAINEAAATTASEALGAKLFRELATGGPNLVFSPLSASKALGMALVGARGETERELRAVLGLVADAEAPKPPRPVSPARHGEGGPLTIANSIWAEKSIELTDSFRRILADSFQAELRKAPFHDNPSGAAEEINSWVANKTRRAIRELFPKGQGINSSTRLLIANAVSFEAAWRNPFPKRGTHDERFSIDEQRVVNVPMMNVAGQFLYAEDAKAQYLEIPYDNPRYAFLVILPRNGSRLDELEGRLFEVFDAKPPFRPVQSTVRIALPRFAISRRFDLAKPLTRLGVYSAFVPGQADFSGMVAASSRDLCITAIVQEALIEVDEAGSRAKAATGAAFGVTSAAPVRDVKIFRADHPFAFAIIDQEQRSIIFAGRLVNPQST